MQAPMKKTYNKCSRLKAPEVFSGIKSLMLDKLDDVEDGMPLLPLTELEFKCENRKTSHPEFNEKKTKYSKKKNLVYRENGLKYFCLIRLLKMAIVSKFIFKLSWLIRVYIVSFSISSFLTSIL
ncbi:hypothetical protein BpHYR1_024140 [Brachionus plicatilis]|uniref:Uncharacterized protein n=1 Tax=Brachionus plicatilis TaxID=10195 RepID=A0A3M7TBD2_BRAPC|nr:hypothetical protein BpHYR1_024140 [Brachionus plicatilis]